MTLDAPICDACGKAKQPDKELLKCGRCRQASYHDKVCQKNHWPKHKARCRQLMQLKQEEEQQRQNLELLDTEDKGRVVVALKDFGPGDVVLLESPAVRFDTRLEYLGLLAAFGAATAETQQKILDLHAPPLEEIDSAARQQRHARLEQQRVAHLQQYPHQSTVLTAETAQKLLAIIETNAHQLFNHSNAKEVDPRQWMGLFCLGSMFEHSCNPSLTMNTTREGRLELLAERSIAKGDRLSFSYIEGIYEKSREQRQQLLREEKHFECQCARCLGLDECRPIQRIDDEKSKCELCHKVHPFFWHAGKQKFVCVFTPVSDNDNTLSLQNDDSFVVQFSETEVQFSKMLQALEIAMEMGNDSFKIALLQIAAILSNPSLKATFHPLHWWNVYLCQFLSQAAAASARMQPKLDVTLLRLSVLALLHNLTWVEQTVRLLRSPPPKTTAMALHKIVETSQTENDATSNTNDAPAPVQLMSILESTLARKAKDGGKVLIPTLWLERAVNIVCSTPADETSVTADSLLTAFFAGQDLLLAGDTDLCLQLYEHYQCWFHKLKQPNDENRARIDVFVASKGKANPFANLIL